jgi:DNA polymerase V
VAAVFALVDGNNFYASCERVFQPKLRDRPLVVLSNNDGCCIARSAEAKALGVRMAQPIHEVPTDIRRQLQVRSANFTLYGDISARIVAILRDAAPQVEVYSIDECFLNLHGIRNRDVFIRNLREQIRRWTGIPNCIGIGPTKTLAKLANKVAKRGAGVVDLTDPATRAAALRDFPVGDLWGVGHRTEAKLIDRGITTAAGLRDASYDDMLASYGVTIARTVRELQGHPCIELEEVQPDRKQIIVSRSFGARVEDHEAVAQAAATFAEIACEKLRKKGLVATALTTFVHTDMFRPELRQHHPARTSALPMATSDTRAILYVVRQHIQRMLRDGYAYKKAGVMLLDLARPESLQHDLFQPVTAGNDMLMTSVDLINRRFGRGTIGLGATGWKDKPIWGMRQQSLSPRYTTVLADLPRARCH